MELNLKPFTTTIFHWLKLKLRPKTLHIYLNLAEKPVGLAINRKVSVYIYIIHEQHETDTRLTHTHTSSTFPVLYQKYTETRYVVAFCLFPFSRIKKILGVPKTKTIYSKLTEHFPLNLLAYI